MWVICNWNNSYLFWRNWRLKVMIRKLIELWHLNFQRTKEEIFASCVWPGRKIENETETMVTNPWNGSLYNWCGSISYGTLGVCNMWKTLLVEQRINFGWYHGGAECHMRERKFWRRCCEGVSSPGGHHGVAPLGKCHYNFLVPVFWL